MRFPLYVLKSSRQRAESRGGRSARERTRQRSTVNNGERGGETRYSCTGEEGRSGRESRLSAAANNMPEIHDTSNITDADARED